VLATSKHCLSILKRLSLRPPHEQAQVMQIFDHNISISHYVPGLNQGFFNPLGSGFWHGNEAGTGQVTRHQANLCKDFGPLIFLMTPTLPPNEDS
jgi:hypothetical protein